jgi:hypothetical protein
MKKAVLLFIVLCSVVVADAQTWEEWTQQKETQKKYLLEQIAALRIYLDHARKGYEIAEKGWNTVQGIKEGDLDLHSEFFLSLSKVNPWINAAPQVSGIMTLEQRALEKIRQARRLVSTSVHFTASEVMYSEKVLDGLLRECAAALEELQLLTTPYQLELSDDERLGRINKTYAAMQETYINASSFSADLQMLAAQRTREQVELHHLRAANGLK